MNTLRINWCKFYVVTNTTNTARFKSLCFVSVCGGGVAYITHARKGEMAGKSIKKGFKAGGSQSWTVGNRE